MEPTGNFAGNGDGCGEWWPLLSAHADGETDPHEARAVEAHIADCPVCARELAGLKRFSLTLSGVTPIEPPLGLQSAILAQTVYRIGFGARIRNALRIPQVQWASLAAAGAAAALLYSFFQPQLPVSQMRVANQTPSGVPKPLVAHVDKQKSAPPAAKQLPLPLIRTGPERQLVSVPPANQTERRPVRAHYMLASQPAAPRVAVAYKPAKLFAPKPRIIERKPNSTLPPSGSDDAEAVMAEAERMTNDRKEVAENRPEPTPGPAVTMQPARIQLVASSAGIPPGQIATLAGLKKELQSQKVSWNAQSVKESLRDKQLRIDVIRGSF